MWICEHDKLKCSKGDLFADAEKFFGGADEEAIVGNGDGGSARSAVHIHLGDDLEFVAGFENQGVTFSVDTINFSVGAGG